MARTVFEHSYGFPTCAGNPFECALTVREPRRSPPPAPATPAPVAAMEAAPPPAETVFDPSSSREDHVEAHERPSSCQSSEPVNNHNICNIHINPQKHPQFSIRMLLIDIALLKRVTDLTRATGPADPLFMVGQTFPQFTAGIPMTGRRGSHGAAPLKTGKRNRAGGAGRLDHTDPEGRMGLHTNVGRAGQEEHSPGRKDRRTKRPPSRTGVFRAWFRQLSNSPSFTPPTKASHSERVKNSFGPSGFLESRST